MKLPYQSNDDGFGQNSASEGRNCGFDLIPQLWFLRVVSGSKNPNLTLLVIVSTVYNHNL